MSGDGPPVIHYDVYRLSGGRWELQDRYARSERERALAEARQIERSLGFPVKVIREAYYSGNNYTEETTIYASDALARHHAKPAMSAERAERSRGEATTEGKKRDGRNAVRVEVKETSPFPLMLRFVLIIAFAVLAAGGVAAVADFFLRNAYIPGSSLGDQLYSAILFAIFLSVFVGIALPISAKFLEIGAKPVLRQTEQPPPRPVRAAEASASPPAPVEAPEEETDEVAAPTPESAMPHGEIALAPAPPVPLPAWDFEPLVMTAPEKPEEKFEAAPEPHSLQHPLPPSQHRAPHDTVLFTDVAASRRHDTDRDLHDTIVRTALSSFAGRELVHTGDGLIASFATPKAGIAAAIAMQRAARDYAADADGGPLPLRIGLTNGKPMHSAEELFGAATQTASQICAAARTGQILCTTAVRAAAGGLAAHAVFAGNFDIPGMTRAMPLYAIRWGEQPDGVGEEEPSARAKEASPRSRQLVAALNIRQEEFEEFAGKVERFSVETDNDYVEFRRLYAEFCERAKEFQMLSRVTEGSFGRKSDAAEESYRQLQVPVLQRVITTNLRLIQVWDSILQRGGSLPYGARELFTGVLRMIYQARLELLRPRYSSLVSGSVLQDADRAALLLNDLSERAPTLFSFLHEPEREQRPH